MARRTHARVFKVEAAFGFGCNVSATQFPQSRGNLGFLPDFDSGIRRFESFRPSQPSLLRSYGGLRPLKPRKCEAAKAVLRSSGRSEGGLENASLVLLVAKERYDVLRLSTAKPSRSPTAVCRLYKRPQEALCLSQSGRFRAHSEIQTLVARHVHGFQGRAPRARVRVLSEVRLRKGLRQTSGSGSFAATARQLLFFLMQRIPRI